MRLRALGSNPVPSFAELRRASGERGERTFSEERGALLRQGYGGQAGTAEWEGAARKALRVSSHTAGCKAIHGLAMIASGRHCGSPDWT